MIVGKTGNDVYLVRFKVMLKIIASSKFLSTDVAFISLLAYARVLLLNVSG